MMTFQSIAQARGYYQRLSWDIEIMQKEINKFIAKGVTIWRKKVLKNMYKEINILKEKRNEVREYIEYYDKYGVVKPIEKSQSSLINFRR